MSTFSHTLSVTYTSPSGQLVSTFTGTGDASIEENYTVAPSSTHAEYDVAVIATSGSSGCQGIFLLASAAMTVYGNSVAGGYVSGNNQNTISLAANQPYFWIAGDGTSPIAANWECIYVTSTAGGTLNIRALQQQ